MLELMALALFLGIIFGSLTGLFPGIHINLVASLLLALIGAGIFLGIDPIIFVVFIVSMSISHTFLDFIPSVFLGAPDDSNFLTVLPGHELLLQGRGYEAIVFLYLGAIISIPFLFFWTLLFILFLPSVYSLVEGIVPYLLLFVSLFLVFREKEILLSLIVFLFAGFLGLLTFELPVKEPLLPLLSGLFGLSGLVVSLKEKTIIPEQLFPRIRELTKEKRTYIRSLGSAIVSAPLCSFLPGIGGGHASVLASELDGEGSERRRFLFMVGAINIIVLGLSFVTAHVIGKGRTGSAAVVQELLIKITGIDLIVILAVIVLSALISFVWGLWITKIYAKNISRLPYSYVSIGVISIILLVTLLLSNWLGFIVLLTGAAIGIFGILSGVRRIELMGCLLVPSIVYYLVG